MEGDPLNIGPVLLEKGTGLESIDQLSNSPGGPMKIVVSLRPMTPEWLRASARSWPDRNGCLRTVLIKNGKASTAHTQPPDPDPPVLLIRYCTRVARVPDL